MNFDNYKSLGICDVCGEKTDVVVCASIMGPISFAYCKSCFEKRLEPYWAMVSYISGAGKFPDDINESYQKHCRYILKELNISEEQFIKDINNEIKEMRDYYEQN